MPDNDLSLVLRRFETTQSILGRWVLNLHVYHQRLRAEWLAYGTAGLKRAFDIAVSFLLLLLLSPLFGIIALLVWLEDGGPVFFAQTRVGQFGREFKMYKVRSMCHDAEQRLKDLLAKNQHQEGVTFKLK